MSATRIASVLALSTLLAAPAAAVEFSAGSNGSDGPLVVDVNSGDVTLQLPPDGVFHFTTVTIEQGRTLRFLRNDRNTPVEIRASDAILVAGTIDVSGGLASGQIPGAGGPGGFDGGAYDPTAGGGWGEGPGGGQAGTDAACTAGSSRSGQYYGNDRCDASRNYGNRFLLPLIGGSGGGAVTNRPRAGNGGGGAILLASDASIELRSGGLIVSNGAAINNNPGGEGSGGAIRLVAPRVFGAGALHASGGYTDTEHFASPGRMRIDTLDTTGLAIGFNPASAGSLGRLMLVRLEPEPRLFIVKVADRDIAEDSASVQHVLAPGSPTTQPVIVRAKGFIGDVPVRVVLTPRTGERTTYDTTIQMNGEAQAEATVNVTFPANVETMVSAWTR